jgi:hypothetical protein
MIGMEWNEICKGNVLKGSVVWMADLETFDSRQILHR